MRHTRFLPLLGALLLPAMACAQDGARQEVTLTAALAAEPDAVWAVVGDFQDMGWHPAIHATEGEGGNEAGATRVLTVQEEGGPTISEELTAHDAENMSFSYRITDVAPEVLPVTDYTSDITVRARDGGGSDVEWHGRFNGAPSGGEGSVEADDQAAVAAVTGVYQIGFDALANEFGAAQ